MPIYSFKCNKCSREVSHIMTFKEMKENLFLCIHCDGSMDRVHKVGKVPLKTIPLVG